VQNIPASRDARPPRVAAVYARKSTEQIGVDAEQKSVERQIENAKAFAAALNCTVPDAYVYSDDAISGAETRKLVARQRLLTMLTADRRPVDVLIMRDSSRFSRRDGDEAFTELKHLAERGIEIWFYGDSKRFTYGDFASNVGWSVTMEMNAEYRRQISKFTHEAMVRKATDGHVTGGRVFGYDNVRLGVKHVVRRINEPEAAVVRRIFDLCAGGTGYTRIAKLLNAERAACPRPQLGRPAGWSPTTVRTVLFAERYRGVVVWNRTKKRNAAGVKAPTARPEMEWLRQDHPDLRIVSESAWDAAHTRLRTRRARVTTTPGRPRRSRDIESPYLLSGFGRCAKCGGSFTVLSRNYGKRRAFVYGCLAHAKRGTTVCDNALVKPLDGIDAAVIETLTRTVLRPAVLRELLAGVFDALTPRNVHANVDALRKDLHALDNKIAKLTAAIENGAALAPIVAQLQTRQTERETLLTAIAAADAVGQLDVDRRAVERKLFAKVEHWRALLEKNPRQFLREALDGPVAFTPVGDAYHFKGVTATGTLIEELIGTSYLCGVPNGIYQRVEVPFSGIAA